MNISVPRFTLSKGIVRAGGTMFLNLFRITLEKE